MLFKGRPYKVIHRFGFQFMSDEKGMLNIDFNEIKKRVTTIDSEGKEVVEKDLLTENEKNELLSAIKAYGFSEVVESKKKD